MSEAQILVHQNSINGFITFTYEWVGSRFLPVTLPDYFLIIREIPWKLIVLHRCESKAETTYLRADNAISYPWYLALEAWYAIRRAWWWFSVRFIVSLTVWGIGYIQPGCEVEWKCLLKKRSKGHSGVLSSWRY